MSSSFRRLVLAVPVLVVAGVAGAADLPPGLQKKFDDNRPLPPGIAKKQTGPGPVSAVPEPGAITLFATGMALYAMTFRKLKDD